MPEQPSELAEAVVAELARASLPVEVAEVAQLVRAAVEEAAQPELAVAEAARQRRVLAARLPSLAEAPQCSQTRTQ